MVAKTNVSARQGQKKDGKQHRYFSVVENRRVGQNQTAQRTVLYLGEINDSQEARSCLLRPANCMYWPKARGGAQKEEPCGAAVRDGISGCHASARRGKKPAALFVSSNSNSRARAKR